MNQRRAKPSQAGEPHIRISYERRAISINVFWTRCDDGEGVICGCYSSGLNPAAKQIVHETGLSRGVVAEEKHERVHSVLVRCSVEWPLAPLVKGFNALENLLTIKNNPGGLSNTAQVFYCMLSTRGPVHVYVFVYVGIVFS